MADAGRRALKGTDGGEKRQGRAQPMYIVIILCRLSLLRIIYTRYTSVIIDIQHRYVLMKLLLGFMLTVLVSGQMGRKGKLRRRFVSG